MYIYLVYAIVPAMLGVFLVEIGVVSNELTDIIFTLKNSLPTVLAILIFIGIISAALSTVDTLLIGCSAIIYNDIIKNNYKKGYVSTLDEIKYVRIILVFIAMLAFTIAVIGIGEIITFLIYLLSIQTSALFISFLFGHFYDTKGYENSALITITLTTIIFIALNKLEVKIWFIDSFIISIICSSLIWMITYTILKKRRRTANND